MACIELCGVSDTVHMTGKNTDLGSVCVGLDLDVGHYEAVSMVDIKTEKN